MEQQGTSMFMTEDDTSEAIWFLGCLAKIKASSNQTGGKLDAVEIVQPVGWASPLHMHRDSDEVFYVLSGRLRGVCGDTEVSAGPGALICMPKEVPHAIAVDGDEPLVTLVLTLPGTFGSFVREAGEPALRREVPEPTAPDMDRLNTIAANNGVVILGPPAQFND